MIGFLSIYVLLLYTYIRVQVRICPPPLFGDTVVGRLGIAGPSLWIRQKLINFPWVFFSQKWWKERLT